MDHTGIDEIVRNGDVEIWSITGVLPMLYHDSHVYGVHVQGLDRALNGRQPPRRHMRPDGKTR